MISVHKISCWVHSTVHNYGCVSVFTHKLWVSVFLGPLFVPPHSPPFGLLSPSLPLLSRLPVIRAMTLNNTELGALSACRQERMSNKGGGGEEASLAARWLAQPVLCQGIKNKNKSAFQMWVGSLPGEMLLQVNATQSQETIIPEPLHALHTGTPSHAPVN